MALALGTVKTRGVGCRLLTTSLAPRQLSFFQIWATAFLTPFGRTFFRTQRRHGGNEGLTQAVIIAVSPACPAPFFVSPLGRLPSNCRACVQFVIIGALKAIVQVREADSAKKSCATVLTRLCFGTWQVYWAVRWLSKRVLRRVEERVLNVN